MKISNFQFPMSNKFQISNVQITIGDAVSTAQFNFFITLTLENLSFTTNLPLVREIIGRIYESAKNHAVLSQKLRFIMTLCKVLIIDNNKLI